MGYFNKQKERDMEKNQAAIDANRERDRQATANRQQITNIHLVDIQNLLADIIREQQRTNVTLNELFIVLTEGK